MVKVTLIPGDGIGPEIVGCVKEVFAAAGARIQWDEVEAGLCSFEKTGQLVPDALRNSLAETRLAMKGPTTTPVGRGHRSINVHLRQIYGLYANVRPIRSLPGVKSRYDEVDLIIVRENSEDLYKGIEYKLSPGVAQSVKLITADASERIGRHAFDLARRLGRRKVTIVHKANIMKLTDGLFLESIRGIAGEYADIEVEDVIVDNMCMQLVTNPGQFDVIVTENLYGDIISDLCAGLVGGLGVAAGGNFGEDTCIFEAVHGSAPDIAGKNMANPTGLLLSGAMMLDYLDQTAAAERIRLALNEILQNKSGRTRDLGGDLSTSAFTEKLVSSL